MPNVDGEARRRILLEGEIPSPANPPSGCVFNTRCPRVIRGVCEVTEPPLVEVEPGHLMSCHIPLEELRRLQRRSTDASAPVLTTPAAPDDIPGAETTVAASSQTTRWRPAAKAAATTEAAKRAATTAGAPRTDGVDPTDRPPHLGSFRAPAGAERRAAPGDRQSGSAILRAS